MASGSTIGREGRAAAAALPESALGRRLASEQEITGGIVTELAHAGDAAAVGVLAQIGRRLGYGLVGVVNVFNPEKVVIGGGRDRGGRAAAGTRPRGGGGASAAADARDGVDRAHGVR